MNADPVDADLSRQRVDLQQVDMLMGARSDEIARLMSGAVARAVDTQLEEQIMHGTESAEAVQLRRAREEAARAQAYVYGLYRETGERLRVMEEEVGRLDREATRWRTRATEAEAMVANYRQQLVGMSATLREFGTTAAVVIQDAARLDAFLERIAGLRRTIEQAADTPNPRGGHYVPPPPLGPGRRYRLEPLGQPYGVYIDQPVAAVNTVRRRPADPIRPDGLDPEMVARELLRDCLTPTQLVDFDATGEFTVVVPAGAPTDMVGRRLRVTQQESMGVQLLNQRGALTGVTYCIVPDNDNGVESPPICDHMLATKLLIESDPATFFRIALRHGRS